MHSRMVLWVYLIFTGVINSMRIGLVGPTAQAWSLPFNAERTVNLFPVLDKRGKEVAALYGTPGLELVSVAGVGAHRASFAAQNGRAFVVSGSTLYEIDSVGASTVRGTLNQSSGNVSIAENGFQMAICDGVTVYIFTYATNAFAEPVSPGYVTAGTITFLDGYFIVSKVGTGEFYISGLYDGLAWAALDFATAESNPDDLLRVYAAVGQLWLLGASTSEIWTNTGASAFPFQKISGANLEVGISAPHSTVAVKEALVWQGEDAFGTGSVYMTTGIRPQRISTEPIEILLQAATKREEITAYSYQQQGHTFYVLTGGGLDTTLVYDFNTQMWHERAYLNAEGDFELHRGATCMFVFDKHIVGDRENGNLYRMDMGVYSDNGDALRRERIYTHLVDEGKRIRYNSLEIGFEVGVGLQNGQGSAPVCSLQLSKDGAKEWSNSYDASIGAVGKYLTKVSFRRLGIAETMTFRLYISDPVKVAISGSYLF